MNISKHETQSLYPSLLHPRDSKPSSFDSATVCGSALPWRSVEGESRSHWKCAANQCHSSNADAKPLRYLQTNLSLTFNKTLQLLTCEKFPAPCFWWCWHHASYWGFPDLHHACPAQSGKPSTTRMVPRCYLIFEAQSEMWKSMKSSSVNSFGFGYNAAFVRFPVSPFSPKGQTGPPSHQALHGLFADLQWWPASARPWKAKP